MNKIFLKIALIFFGLSQISYADAVVVQTSTSVPAPLDVKWVSKNSTDEIAINNGTGELLTITINVDPGNAGINIKNCGNTTQVKAGSPAVCTTNDPVNFVTFTSDNPALAASGTYRINTHKP